MAEVMSDWKLSDECLDYLFKWDLALNNHVHFHYPCGCNGMKCNICTAPGMVCRICGKDFKDPEERCSGPHDITIDLGLKDGGDDDLPF